MRPHEIADQLRKLGDKVERAQRDHRFRDAVEAQNKIGELVSRNLSEVAAALDAR